MPNGLARVQGDGRKDARKAVIGGFTVSTALAVSIPEGDVGQAVTQRPPYPVGVLHPLGQRSWSGTKAVPSRWSGSAVPSVVVRDCCANFVGQSSLCQAGWLGTAEPHRVRCAIRDLCAKRCGQGPLCQLVGQGLLCQALWSGCAVPEALFRDLGLELTQGTLLRANCGGRRGVPLWPQHCLWAYGARRVPS